MKATINFEELHGIVRLFEERGRRAMGELAPAIAEAMHSEVLEVFETEGYGTWPQFADSTLDRKLFGPRKSSNPKLLQDTGVMVGSLTPNWDEDIVEVYTNIPYAKYHVSHEPRRVIPLRDFFAIDIETFEGDVADMLLLRLTRPEAA